MRERDVEGMEGVMKEKGQERQEMRRDNKDIVKHNVTC